MYIRIFSIILCLSVYLTSSTPAQDRQSEAENLFTEAETLRVSDKAESKREAIKKYEAAILIFKELILRPREATAFNNIGNIYLNLSEFANALTALEKSLQISREINDQNLQTITLLNMGRTFRLSGKQENALVHFDRALAISRETSDKEKQAAALNGLGAVYYSLGETRKSLEHLELAASIFEELGQQIPRATLLNNIGLINRTMGNQDEAIEQYNTALAIFRASKHRAGEADVTLNLSAAYSDQFRNAEAMEYFNRALEMFREAGDRQREAVILNNIGVFYNKLGDQEKSLDFYNQSAAIAENIGDRRQFASALKNLGILYINLNETDKAFDYLTRALDISQAVKDRLNEAWVLSNIGLIYDKKGDYEKARQNMLQALEIFRALGNREGEARTLLNLGLTSHHTNEYKNASEYYAQALRFSRELQTPGEEARVLLHLARLVRDFGSAAEARVHIEQAIGIIESLRAAVPGQELRTSFFSLGKDSYELYIDLLMQENSGKPSPENIAKAMETSERARARSLLETLSESRAEIRRGADEKLLERERALQNRLNAKENYRIRLLSGKPKPEQIEAVQQEIRSLLNEYQQIRTQIQIKNPNYAALIYPQPLSLKEIQQNVLDRNTLLLEYALGEDRSYLWAITPDSITSHTLPKRADIENAARRFYKLLTARNEQPENEPLRRRSIRLDAADKELNEAARYLGKILIGPIYSQIGGKRLIIVADGVLQYFPFAALSPKSKVQSPKLKTTNSPLSTLHSSLFLIETNEIINLPSASTLAVLRKASESKKTGAKNLVAVLADAVFTGDDARVQALAKQSGNDAVKDSDFRAKLLPSKLRSDFSRLRFSRSEAETISALAQNNQKFVAMDFAANLQTATSADFADSRIIHFATHGVVNSEFPELSGVVLSLIDENGSPREGFLRLHDIYNLRLNADLVVLSACETALGKEIKGEGIVGLTRGFMYAGAPRVVASLWRVEDRATADLMKRFYQKMLKEKLPPSSALREAQISMIKEKTLAHPFFWAGFTLQGDWRE